MKSNIKPNNCVLVIFGASGDLSQRKLIPALFELFKQKLLPEGLAVLGTGRTMMSHDEFRSKMALRLHSGETATAAPAEHIDNFVKRLYYLRMDSLSEDHYPIFKKQLNDLNVTFRAHNNYLFYLAMPPLMYEPIIRFLGALEFNVETNGFKRIIIEKPFGYDLESGRRLNQTLHEVFAEDQIYRIDHYLGKETVQNILVTRFSNGIFEPLWNRNYIHHVEITSAESLGVENRGGYYDGAGALRDMVQNHLLQMVGLTAMEPPSALESNAIRNEVLKVFLALRPLEEKDIKRNVIRGQYTTSVIGGRQIYGYRDETGVNPQSRTETFVAMKFYIDNRRWSGVPFYIRTGKRLPTRVTEIVIHFMPAVHQLFSRNNAIPVANQLILRIQPDEGILLKFGMKVPGAGFNVQNVNMDFHYRDLGPMRLPDAYERLLYDAMSGDSTLYARADAVEAAWEFVSPIQHVWNNDPDCKIYGYPAGTWGPAAANQLFDDKNLSWRYPCKNLTDDGLFCEL